MRALITGATGFAGSHLVDTFPATGWDVHGTCLHTDLGAQTGGRATYHPLDLREAQPIARLVAHLQPDAVFHLAAQASVAAAWADPAATLTDNLVVAQRLLEAVRAGAREARVLVVSSSEVYGTVETEGTPVTEDTSLRPVDPYGVSKAAVELVAQQYQRAFGMRVVIVRPFNHIGPRQRRGFVLPDFAAGIVAIERDEAPPVLLVGNMETARDFTDVRDVVRAYRLALDEGQPGSVYNICSGTAVTIGALLDSLLAAATVRPRIEVDPGRYRPIDRPAIVGSYASLERVSGWRPAIPLRQTVEDTLEYWRALPAGVGAR